MTCLPIGWATVLDCRTISRGASDTLRHGIQIMQPNNTPLPSYEGFIASVVLRDQSGQLRYKSGNIAAIADPDNDRIIIDVPFASSVIADPPDDHTRWPTINWPLGKLIGTMVVTDPTDGSKQVPVQYNVEVVL